MLSETYWAAAEAEELGENLKSKVDQYADDALLSKINERYRRAYQYYFGLDPSGVHATSQILRGGDQGELAEVKVNHSRPLVNTLLNLIVAPKVVWSPKAVNIDSDSLAQCELTQAILEYYWSEKSVAKFATRALEDALVFTEGFVHPEWDPLQGDDVLSTGNELMRTGDLRFTNVQTWNVLRDPNKQSFDELDWVIIRLHRNKWDLAARYPAQAEDICKATDDRRIDHAHGTVKYADGDDIALYKFFHKRSPALPMGKQAVFLDDGTVLEAGDLEGDTIPLYRVSAGELTGTPYGYSPFLDVLGVQELMDSLHTIVASNQTTFAGQLIAVEHGSEVPIDQLAGGMKAIYYAPGSKPPEALQLVKTPNEVFGYLDSLKKHQELLIGLNSVVRGEPQSGEQSGSALVMLQQQALQQSSVIQANYLRLVEGIGNCVVYIIQQHASITQKVAIAGKANASLVTDYSYTGDDISAIKRVQVEVGNPLSQTGAGRIEMAKELINVGLIKSPEQYMAVLQTGRIEPLTRSLSKELLLIRGENEQLTAGEPVEAFMLDDHLLHMREHRGEMADLAVRRNPAAVDAYLAHLRHHEHLYFTTPPQFLSMTGQTPPAMQPPGPGGPPGQSGAPPGSPPGLNAQTPKLPEPPKNPTTGQPWNPVDAGGAVPRQ